MASITFDVEMDDLLDALDGVTDAIRVRLKSAERVTADRIAEEASGRVARRTGQTAAGITVEETYDKSGYVVYVKVSGGRWLGLPAALEYGTSKMSARPFLQASARLEEGPHERRVDAAIEQAINETGLGE